MLFVKKILAAEYRFVAFLKYLNLKLKISRYIEFTSLLEIYKNVQKGPFIECFLPHPFSGRNSIDGRPLFFHSCFNFRRQQLRIAFFPFLPGKTHETFSLKHVFQFGKHNCAKSPSLLLTLFAFFPFPYQAQIGR